MVDAQGGGGAYGGFAPMLAAGAHALSAAVGEHLAVGLLLLAPAAFLLHFYALTALRGGKGSGPVGGGKVSFWRAFWRCLMRLIWSP